MEVLFLLFFLSSAQSVKHSLKFFFIGSSGVTNIPAFLSVVKIDEIEVVHFDSNVKKAEPKQEWMDFFIQFPEEKQFYILECLHSSKFFINAIDVLTKCCIQTEGVHTFQRMYGCEWDDESKELKDFDQYSYDGENVTQGNTVQHEWDKIRIEHMKHYVYKCPYWLEKFLNYGKSFLQRTVRPSVSLLQNSLSSPISCHATGFYPDRATMFWRKDGQELHEDVDHGEILPNHDGTFQMTVDLKCQSLLDEDWWRYDCVFQFSDVKDAIITRLDKAVIRTNTDYAICTNPEIKNTIIVTAITIIALLLIELGLLVYKTMTGNLRSYMPILLPVILLGFHGFLFYKLKNVFYLILSTRDLLKWRRLLPRKG
ncbi:Major histocompatibility complex class I-related gene protein [Channa argus]|uniref:Major histocompatibility complex class I-related gene protein n=1 Tax=Channa argus TaxID=215402 RepID=A0A6G1QWL6_CHAAH|nr:Major histocompatibility complex class I-related gene protein [Channa argus]